MEVLLHSELLLCDCLVGETGRAHHRPVNVCHLDNNTSLVSYLIIEAQVYLLFQPHLCLPHIVQYWSYHRNQKPSSQNIELERQNDYFISPDEEHGLGPAGGLCVPGVAQYQPPHLGCPHGLHHGTGGSNIAPSDSNRQVMACRLYNTICHALT